MPKKPGPLGRDPYLLALCCAWNGPLAATIAAADVRDSYISYVARRDPAALDAEAMLPTLCCAQDCTPADAITAADVWNSETSHVVRREAGDLDAEVMLPMLCCAQNGALAAVWSAVQLCQQRPATDRVHTLAEVYGCFFVYGRRILVQDGRRERKKSGTLLCDMSWRRTNVQLVSAAAMGRLCKNHSTSAALLRG